MSRFIFKTNKLVSMDGQYLGPTPFTTPEYIDDLFKLFKIHSCVSGVVYVK